MRQPSRAQILTGVTFHPSSGETASAVGVVGEQILAVGDLEDVSAQMPRGTEEVDLGGGFAFPGFVDSHVHFLNLGRSRMGISCWPSEVDSVAGIVERTRAAAIAAPPGKWLRGRGFDPSRLTERRSPTADELDVATGDPVVIDGFDFHRRVVNHAALEAAGIDSESSDPVGGKIIRDESGSPTGELLDAARGLVDAVMPPWSEAEDREAVTRASDVLLEAGFTAATNAAPLGMKSVGEEVRAFTAALEARSLPIRLTTMIGRALLEEVEELGLPGGFGDDRLRIDGIKVFLDGAFGPRTAAVLEPYEGSDDVGHLSMERDEFSQVVERATAAGWRVCVHAIGDRAVEMAATVLAGYPHRVPHRIEHCCLSSETAIERMVAGGVVPVPQIPFLRERSPDFVTALGSERMARLFPLRRWIDSGLRPLHSSDAPVVEDVRPMAAAETAITRIDGSGDRWGPSNGIAVHEAIAMLTEWAGSSATCRRSTGRIETGHLADFTVLDDDPFAKDPGEMSSIEAKMTIVGGAVAWQR